MQYYYKVDSLRSVMNKIVIVIPNLNGAKYLGACLDSLIDQTQTSKIIVVDNVSTDESCDLIKSQYPTVRLIELNKNTGFAGGVNTGIKAALQDGAQWVALFNNDAVADKNWLAELIKTAKSNPRAGIVTGKLWNHDKTKLDSTGEQYSTWGLPFARGRDETNDQPYNQTEPVFGASGGASIYRSAMLVKIGIFDEKFFAYYEDVDISFRAQLAGWQVFYTPKALAYHRTGSTSSKIKGFTTYQTMKNLPMLYWKNMPLGLALKSLPKFSYAYCGFLISAFQRHQGLTALKGLTRSILLIPHSLIHRRRIQKSKVINNQQLASSLYNGLPPRADRLQSQAKQLKHFLKR